VRNFKFRLISLGLAVSAFVLKAAAQEPPTTAMIDHITCDALWRPSYKATEAEKITEYNNRGMYLRGRDEVKCTSKQGNIIIILSDGTSKTVTADMDWSSATDIYHQTIVARALKYHGPRAGTRGQMSRVLYPHENAVVRPEQFVIRWKPDPNPGKIALSIWALGDRRPRWSDVNIDGSAGLLDSVAARQALEDFVSANPNVELNVFLEFKDNSGTTTTVPFRLLSADESQALTAELKSWDQEQNTLLRSIGRAYSFDSRNLYWEAAREYEEALMEAPRSCDLLNEALAANQRAVDQEHVRQLKEARSKILGGCPDRISQ
jgi:hypothetical protein